MALANTSTKTTSRRGSTSTLNVSEKHVLQETASELSLATLVEKPPSRYQKVKSALSQAADIQSRRLAGEWPQDSIHSRASRSKDHDQSQPTNIKAPNRFQNVLSEAARINGKTMSGGWT